MPQAVELYTLQVSDEFAGFDCKKADWPPARFGAMWSEYCSDTSSNAVWVMSRDCGSAGWQPGTANAGNATNNNSVAEECTSAWPFKGGHVF